MRYIIRNGAVIYYSLWIILVVDSFIGPTTLEICPGASFRPLGIFLYVYEPGDELKDLRFSLIVYVLFVHPTVDGVAFHVLHGVIVIRKTLLKAPLSPRRITSLLQSSLFGCLWLRGRTITHFYAKDAIREIISKLLYGYAHDSLSRQARAKRDDEKQTTPLRHIMPGSFIYISFRPSILWLSGIIVVINLLLIFSIP